MGFRLRKSKKKKGWGQIELAYDISLHAIERFIERTGTPPMIAYQYLVESLYNAKQISSDEAYMRFNLTWMLHGYKFYIFKDEVSGKILLAIVSRDSTLVTVLEEKTSKTKSNKAWNKF